MKSKLTFLLFAAFLLMLSGCPKSDRAQSVNDEGRPSGSLGSTDSKPNDTGKVTPKKDSVPAPKKEPNDSKDSKFDSVYTDLAEDKCKTTSSSEEEAWSVQSCDGIAGYSLEVIEGDIRQTINVIAPNKKKSELNFWSVVSSGFSSVGKKAEWRVTKEKVAKPIALIVRYDVSDNPDNPDKTTSYLTVTKITETATCVTDVVRPMKNANVKARNLADVAASKPCKTSK